MIKYLWIIVIASILSVLVVWTPFALRVTKFWGIDFGGRSMLTIAQNYDGLNFLVVARSWYNPEVITRDYSQLVGERGTRYFAAHYPGYALVVAFFDLFLNGPQAIYASIITSNVLLAVGLYWFFGTFAPKKLYLYMSLLALFLPPRIMPLRAIGANELICLFLILTSLVLYQRQKKLGAAILGSLAVLTRSPAILLFFAYLITENLNNKLTLQERIKKSLPFMLMPTTLLLLFGYYGIVYGDVFAYFKVGGNLNFYLPPFMTFASELPWISGFWREDIMYLYLMLFGGVALLWEYTKTDAKTKILSIFASIYTLSLLFVAHRDVSRYSILIAPLMVLAYTPQIVSWKYRQWLLLLLIPLLLYSWNFVLGNIQPVADWTPFL